MLKKINRVLKLVGLNLVRAKRKKAVKSAGIPYDASKHMGECEWQNIPPSIPGGIKHPPNDGRTHYVGDDCPGGHREGTENCCIGPEAKVFVGNPNANFVPVDIGVDDHEITRAEQPTHSRGCCCAKCIEEFDKPRVPQPNSDNKISGPTS